jgi:tRNA A64-2'-O-ribosylphosphate transferase
MAAHNSLPVSVSQLHFPSPAHGSLSHVLSDLRRSALSVANRLRSIETDARFVQEVADRFDGQLPLVANERCGSWYIPADRKGGSVYFKSTDGHAGQWDFSLRRLNLQVLDIVGKHGGCIIVDSTRRGKAMPDALSKSVPIWCSVMNRALFPDATEYHDVQFLPNLLPGSEEAQIQSRIAQFVESFKVRLQRETERRYSYMRLICFCRL